MTTSSSPDPRAWTPVRAGQVSARPARGRAASRPLNLGLLGLLVLLGGGTALAQESPGPFSLAGGIHYSTGHYGAPTTTEILYVPLTARYQTDSASASLTVPYIALRGNGIRVPGGVVFDSIEHKRITASGLGDVAAAGSYTVYRGTEPVPWIDLTASVKFGTADPDQQLGTGKIDYAGQVDAYQRAGRFNWFASLGYRVPGSPKGLEFRRVTYGSAGSSVAVTPDVKAGLMWSGQEALTAHGHQQSEASAFAGWALNPRYALQAYYSRGLALGSADWATGVTLARTF